MVAQFFESLKWAIVLKENSKRLCDLAASLDQSFVRVGILATYPSRQEFFGVLRSVVNSPFQKC